MATISKELKDILSQYKNIEVTEDGRKVNGTIMNLQKRTDDKRANSAVTCL